MSSSVTPPYIAYRTFRTFLEFLQEGMPEKIDRNFWGERFSGTSGNQLMSALRALSLVDENDSPTSDLEDLVLALGGERHRVLKRILMQFYKPLFEIDLANATKVQFSEAFRRFGIPEQIQIKCEVFFVHAAQDAGIELSRFILKGRHIARNFQKVPVAVQQTQRENDNQNEAKSRLEIATLILSKYPVFDVKWNPDVQKQWFIGVRALYDGLT